MNLDYVLAELKDMTKKVGASQQTYHNRNPYRGYVLSEQRNPNTREKYLGNLETTEDVTERSPRFINEWDYFDQRYRLNDEPTDYVPRAKTTKKRKYEEEEDESPMYQRPGVLTYFHNFPKYNLPFLNPPNDEITPVNYIYVSTLSLLNKY